MTLTVAQNKQKGPIRTQDFSVLSSSCLGWLDCFQLAPVFICCCSWSWELVTPSKTVSVLHTYTLRIIVVYFHCLFFFYFVHTYLHLISLSCSQTPHIRTCWLLFLIFFWVFSYFTLIRFVLFHFGFNTNFTKWLSRKGCYVNDY